jgi:hypothetical protein
MYLDKVPAHCKEKHIQPLLELLIRLWTLFASCGSSRLHTIMYSMTSQFLGIPSWIFESDNHHPKNKQIDPD